jgi:hypothetical protein
LIGYYGVFFTTPLASYLVVITLAKDNNGKDQRPLAAMLVSAIYGLMGGEKVG